ncbi:MAG TPA: 6-phosphogluconolactonase, partial [Gemmatimonadales bacterium]|nr:6-phosphogluconolactonase [Gemmatimonadales bacterium]
YWGDERCVAPDDPASNFLSARTALLDRVEVDSARIHRMRGEDDPTLAAAGYEQLLRREFRTPTGPPTMRPEGRFDLVLLGLGRDGHVASLLPGRLPSPTDERWVVPISAQPWTRLTLTPAVINAAREVMLLVSGPAKAAIVARVLAPPGPGDALPAHLIRPRNGVLRWMLDAAAAARLPP